jgi:anti-sigma regulatory factor (Ser/Thr protein kinase)
VVGHLSDRSPQSGLSRLLFATEFDASRLTDARHEVDIAVRRCGLDPDKSLDFIAAVNEAMTNAVRHGGGRGALRLSVDTQLTCEIHDDGPGFPADRYLNRTHRPTPSPAGGMGLWIAQQTSDALSIDSGSAGTTVRIGMTLPPAARP